MSKFTFSRVPGYDTWTGDRRIRSNIRRSEFVCFVIDIDTMRGMGFKASTLAEVRNAADYFQTHFEFPNGTKP